MSDFELVWDAECQTAESPVWDAAHRRILFADMRGGRVLAYGVDDGSRQTWQLPGAIGSFGLCRSGRLIVALHRKLIFFDLERGTAEDFTAELDEPDINKFNDGRPGPDGAYWVGTIDGRTPAFQEDTIRDPNGSLYRIDADGTFERKAQGFKASNGIVFSPDGRILYFADTANHFVDAFDLDRSSGAISNQRRYLSVDPSDGRPDGAAGDADGCYWSAGVSMACLNKFSPTGELLEKIPLPCPAPTMPCFAEGSLYVTSLRRNPGDLPPDSTLARLPHNVAGLFKGPAPTMGVEVAFFAD